VSNKRKKPRIGLIGTITYDLITQQDGKTYKGLGGVLYQAAVLCGFGCEVRLYTNLGKELADEVDTTTKEWTTLHRKGINHVPGPGNRVFLHYPKEGERVEVLESVVPPLDPAMIIRDLPHLDLLVLVINSGFDIKLTDWHTIKQSAACPIWMDVHSLPLEKKLNSSRRYVPTPEWKEWAAGVDYIQVNKAELAALVGRPGEDLPASTLDFFFAAAAERGTKTVFVTLGAEGIWVMNEKYSKKIPVEKTPPLLDSTGCGDVFCAGTILKISKGNDAFAAARFGMRLASAAVGVSGIASTFQLSSGVRH
jgi:sugar/nucleoside kinase (ribokinase family)